MRGSECRKNWHDSYAEMTDHRFLTGGPHSSADGVFVGHTIKVGLGTTVYRLENGSGVPPMGFVV